MKRIIALLIATALCLGMLTGCQAFEGLFGPSEEPATATVADAISFLHDIYKTKKEITSSDFDVISKVKIGDTEFPVAWTSDSDKVTIKESSKAGYYTVDLPDTNTEEFSYKLTATITFDGVSESKTYTFKMPAIDNSGITSTPVEGVAYKLFLLQGSENRRYYALNSSQNNENKFINTTLNPKDGAEFFVEKVDGGYKIYTDVNGVKTYMYAKVTRSEDANGTVKYSKYIGFNAEEGSVFTYNETKGGVWTVTVDNLVYGVGTYGSYTTISISDESYFTPEKVGDSQFVLQFMTAEYANTLEEDKLPESPSDAKGILDQLYALADGESAVGEFTLTGKITALDNYKNPTIVVEGYENMPVYCYRLSVENAIGDTITVTATQMKNYGGTYEFMNCTLVSGGNEGGDNGDTPAGDADLGIVANPEIGVAYKFGLYHGNEKATVFFNGQNYNNYAWYFAYDATGIDVYLEAVEGVDGGYRLFFYNGDAKTYVVAFPRDGDTTKGTLKFDTVVPDTYFTFNTEYNTLIYTSVTGEQFYLGSSGTYTSISCSAISYISNATSYVAHLYAEGATGDEAPHTHEFVNGKCACGEVDPDYVAPDMPTDGNYTIPQVLAAAEGTEVKVTGTVESFYYAWDDSYGNCSVYIVDDAGNKLLCFRLKTKVEIGDNITVTGTVAVYNGTNQLAQGCTAVINGGNSGSDTPVEPQPHEHNFVDGKCECGETDPSYQQPEGGNDFMSIADVLASGEGTKVKFTGTVSGFYEDWSSYNNCSPYIVDDAGNKILVFRTTTHVYDGDVVTVEGTVTIYNNTPQIDKNGSVVTVVTAHTCDYTEATCTEASACKSCGKAGATAALGHTAANAEGKCDRCGLNLSVSYVEKNLSFSSTANRTSLDSNKQVWTANGVTLTNEKGASTSNVADYSNPARFYKSSKITVEAVNIVEIEFKCNSSSYASVLQSSIATSSDYTVTLSGSSVIVKFTSAVNSFVIDSLTGGQVRVNELTVTCEG